MSIPETAVNPKDLIGATKAPLGIMPWTGIVQMGPVFAVGAEKYGPLNWREYAVQRVTYLEAALRHILADLGGETVDPETGLLHIAHAAAGLCILLDALAVNSTKDNRPLPGNTAEMLKVIAKQAATAVELTQKLKAAKEPVPAEKTIVQPDDYRPGCSCPSCSEYTMAVGKLEAKAPAPEVDKDGPSYGKSMGTLYAIDGERFVDNEGRIYVRQKADGYVIVRSGPPTPRTPFVDPYLQTR